MRVARDLFDAGIHPGRRWIERLVLRSGPVASFTSSCGSGGRQRAVEGRVTTMKITAPASCGPTREMALLIAEPRPA